MKKSFKRLFFCLSFIAALYSFDSYILAQKKTIVPSEPNGKEFQVSWVEQISTSTMRSEKPGFLNRLLKILIGEKQKKLLKPFNVLFREPSSVWILDQGNQHLVHLETTDNKVKIVESKSSEFFPSLVGICNWINGSILFTDSQLNKIFYQPDNTKKPTVLNDTLNLNHPTGIAYSKSTQKIWLAETQAHRLLILNNAGVVVDRIGKRGTSPGEFNFPTFLWIDHSGLIYVVDSMNFRIQVLDPEGQVQAIFGEPGDATGYFARPKGIATDSYGHIYVVDAIFNTVQIFNRKGEFLFNFGKQGRGKGEFWLPAGIFIAKDNHIYIADSYNARIQVFKLHQ